MSEKQFKLSSEIVLQYQIMDNDTDLNENEVVDLLNSLSDKTDEQQVIITGLNKQIEQLHLAIDDLLSYTSCEEIKKENKKLKEENEKLKAKIKRLQDIATRTEAEKEEYADLYCKCENELIKNRRRFDDV